MRGAWLDNASHTHMCHQQEKEHRQGEEEDDDAKEEQVKQEAVMAVASALAGMALGNKTGQEEEEEECPVCLNHRQQRHRRPPWPTVEVRASISRLLSASISRRYLSGTLEIACVYENAIGGVTRWSEISFHYCTRLIHSSAISVVLT